MTDYLPDKDYDLKAWLGNFYAVAEANLPALGLSAADMTPLGADGNAYNSSLDAVQTSRAAAQSAVKAKDAARKKMVGDIRPIVKRIQSHPGVPDALKTQLGIAVAKPAPARTPPITPGQVIATPHALGFNALKWHATGNKPATQYVIQAKTLAPGVRADADTGWTMVGLTTRRDFKHQGVTPGVPMAYRVIAARADQNSGPSLAVTVYGG